MSQDGGGAAAGGVMYTRDPTNIRREVILLNAVHGLAKTVVDGSVTPDLWEVSRTEPLTITKREINHKEVRAMCLPGEGVVLEPDPEGDRPALSDAQVMALAEMALQLEEHFQAPQDIEWSIDGEGRLYILQSRPLKQLTAGVREAAEALNIPNPVILRGGERASPGVAAGPAFLVRNNLDVLQFPEGAVLVTAFAHPGWATLLPRAGAVVTDRGGITGHLANVAREFGIPALFNTFDATHKIEPGREITVDADGHNISGEITALLFGAFQIADHLIEAFDQFSKLRRIVIRHADSEIPLGNGIDGLEDLS